jgi:predicted phage tail protein
VSVTFTVAAAPVPPAIGLSPTSVSFNATAGGGNPANQTINVANSGTGTLDGLGTSVSYASGQPTGWLNANLSGTTAPATISLQASTGSLAAGTYNATVSVTAGVASNSPQTVSVTFTVAAGTLPAAPTNLNANGQGNNMIRLTWVDSSNDEQSFEIQRNTTGNNGPWTTIASLPANTIDYRDRNYVPGVTYWYRVLACNAVGCSSSNVDTGSN